MFSFNLFISYNKPNQKPKLNQMYIKATMEIQYNGNCNAQAGDHTRHPHPIVIELQHNCNYNTLGRGAQPIPT